MARFDLEPARLRTYQPQLHEPADFDDFWADTLAQTREQDLDVRLRPVESGLPLVETYDVRFAGFGGHPINAWLVLPGEAYRSGRALPAVVQYVGYGGGRGLPHEHLTWAGAGYAVLVMDTRGQGSGGGTGGDTPDPVGSGPATPGMLTRGLLDPAQHYYRRVFTDGVRAVEAVRTVPQIDPARVVIAGASQGGGIALAVAGLVPDLAAALPDVPFLCQIARAIELTDELPYAELTRWLSVHRDKVDPALRTLGYLDAVHFARRANAPALFSVAFMDQVCPPSTVYAAFNHYGALALAADRLVDKAVVEYPYNGHEGGGGYQVSRQIRWLAGLFGRD